MGRRDQRIPAGSHEGPGALKSIEQETPHPRVRLDQAVTRGTTFNGPTLNVKRPAEDESAVASAFSGRAPRGSLAHSSSPVQADVVVVSVIPNQKLRAIQR